MALQEIISVQVVSEKKVGYLEDILTAFDKYYSKPSYLGDKKYPDFYPLGCNASACVCGS